MSRVRSRVLRPSQFVMDSYTRSWKYCPQTEFSDDIQYQGMNTGSRTETCVDVETDAWKSKIAKGEVINSPFKRTIYDNVIPGNVSFSNSFRTYCAANTPKEAGWDMSGKVYATFIRNATRCKTLYEEGYVPGGLKSEIIDAAVVDAHANVDVSEMMALASLAESGKAVSSMSSILRRVLTIARNVRRLNIRELAGELSPKEVADRYMEARYALRPLMYDAVGVMRAIEVPREKTRRTFRGYAEASHSNSDVVQDVGVMTSLSCSMTRTLDYSVSARAGILCDVEVDAMSAFGVDQLAETLWELVPFSFIVDWFTNIGDIIAAWTPNAGINQLASWVTVKETMRSFNTPGNATCTVADTIRSSATIGAYTYGIEILDLERFVEPTTLVLPRFDLNLDTYKLLDLGIILRRVF